MSSYLLSLLFIGLLLLFVATASGWMTRLPISYALIYLLVGVALGPQGVGLINLRLGAEFLERLTELVVIVSLFGCGLKLNRPLRLGAWHVTARLIGFLMPISIFFIAVASHWLLGLGVGEASLLGAILAPTDPILASEIQVANNEDRDEVRFNLTSEGGLNDALAFPFVYFGLFWLQDSNWQNWFKEWVWAELIWATVAAIIMGIVIAKSVSWIDEQLQRFQAADRAMEDFVAISTILLAYSLTELVEGYGFLAVFVAGLEIQHHYQRKVEERLSQLELTEQIGILLEIGTILILGGLLRIEPMLKYGGGAFLIAGLLFFLIRPLGVWVSTIGSGLPTPTRLLMGWFGIRSVCSIYYVSYALSQKVDVNVGEGLTWITYLTVLFSLILHGVSTKSLMSWYERKVKGNSP